MKSYRGAGNRLHRKANCAKTFSPDDICFKLNRLLFFCKRDTEFAITKSLLFCRKLA